MVVVYNIYHLLLLLLCCYHGWVWIDSVLLILVGMKGGKVNESTLCPPATPDWQMVFITVCETEES